MPVFLSDKTSRTPSTLKTQAMQRQHGYHAYCVPLYTARLLGETSYMLEA